MPSRAWQNPTRWRRFADLVAVLLGVNVWVSVVLLPELFVGAWHARATPFVAAMPLAVLAAGLWRRSELLLLLAFPAALLVPVAAAPEIVSAHVYGPLRFAVVASGLLAYLFGASFFTAFYEPPPPAHVRPLSSSAQPTAPRWRRRFRLYRGLTALSAAFPVGLLWAIEFDRQNQAFLHKNFPARATTLTTALELVAIGVWVALFAAFFLAPLRDHRTGDRAIAGELARLRAEAMRARPRPIFYVGVAAALGLVALLLALRHY